MVREKIEIIAKVSIVVPCYNVEKYIEKCLESLINQSYKNLEIVCVNDGSIDSTPNLLENFSQKDERIKVITQKNGGLSCARNTGISNCTGEYITFVDSDDWISENYIENLCNAIIKNDCDIAVAEMIRQRPNAQKYRLHFDSEIVYENLQDKINVCRIPMCCYACGKLFKKNLINEKEFKSGVYFEDVVWTPEVIKSSDKLVVVPNAIYFYRVNPGSIVKSVQSLKKQHDSYIAKSYIVKFFEENNLKLADKYKSVTKYIKYIGGVPLFKVKECNGCEITLLFGFLPIYKKQSGLYYRIKKYKHLFLFKKLDSHMYANILGIHIGVKIKTQIKDCEVKTLGITNEKRDEQLIVSLTSFPDRINFVHLTIKTLLNQSLKPNKLILWLAESQFKNKEKDLPNSLLDLKKYGLEVRWCDDFKSYKKLVPALIEFPNDVIVTADDDLYYQNDWLESLYSAYLQDKSNIYTRRACRVEKKDDFFVIIPNYANNLKKPSYCNQLMGGAGTLYPPKSLYKDVLDMKNILNLIPTYDDIYFWAMALMNNSKIALVDGNDLSIYNVENSQNTALCKINRNNVGMSDKEAFNKIFEQYPKLIDKLGQERD